MKKFKHKKTAVALIILAAVALIASMVVLRNNIHEKNLIGGERDEHGCLIPAGYSWNKTLGVCLREWEADDVSRQVISDIRKDKDEEYGLTFLNISKGDCEGCLIVWLQKDSGLQRSIELEGVKLNGTLLNFCSEVQRGPGIYCIQVYEPVCGSDNKTYSNSCIACLNSSVAYYTEGECKE